MENQVCLDCLEFKLSCKGGCEREFNELLPPLIYECGHSLCQTCINSLREHHAIPMCPICKEPLQRVKLTDCPINHFFLEAFTVIRDLKRLSLYICPNHLTRRTKEGILAADIDTIQKLLARVGKSLKAVDRDDDHNSNIQIALQQMAETFSQIGIINDSDKPLVDGHFVTLDYEDFQSRDKYFDEILLNIRNKDDVFTYVVIEKKSKYGRMSMEKNMILFHSLTCSEAPLKSTLIKFHDLRNFDIQSFGMFLDICCGEKGLIRMVSLEMLDSHLVSQFIKRCTGECGSAYRDCSYIKGDDIKGYYESILEVDFSIQYGRAVKLDYCPNFGRSIKFRKGDIVLEGNDYGKFNIIKLKKDQPRPSAIAKVLGPENLENCINYQNGAYLRIIDSGIFLKI